MPLAKFGPFAEVFAQGELAVPGHLELLGLHQPGAQIVLDGRQTLTPTALWRAVDAGSWVLPQLVVCAHIVDSDFPSQCRDRMRAGAPVAPVPDLSPVERHSATGPGNARQRSAKL